jgi:hypothetical protein
MFFRFKCGCIIGDGMDKMNRYLLYIVPGSECIFHKQFLDPRDPDIARLIREAVLVDIVTKFINREGAEEELHFKFDNIVAG